MNDPELLLWDEPTSGLDFIRQLEAERAHGFRRIFRRKESTMAYLTLLEADLRRLARSWVVLLWYVASTIFALLEVESLSPLTVVEGLSTVLQGE